MKEISAEIVTKAAQGDTEAFKFIYDHTASLVYNVSFRISGSREDAQEITQDVFYKAYTHLDSFEHKSSFKTWLYRITVNTALNFVKKQKKRQNNKVFDDRFEYEQEQVTMQEKEARAQAEKKVQELLDQLNPDQRACMVLRVLEGMKYKEIAKVLKIKINTVRSRLIRARRILLDYQKETKRAPKE